MRLTRCLVLVLSLTCLIESATGFILLALVGTAIGVASNRATPNRGGRGRRSLDAIVDQAIAPDASRCACRLLCELHQKPFDQLDAVGQHLVKLFE